jgi:GT2 family glycosyltransferase
MVSVVVLSRKPPKRVLRDLNNQVFKDFEVILAKDKGIVKAMNNALEKAKGSIFVRIDDDVELPPYWLRELTKPFANPDVAGVTGPTYVPMRLRKNRDSLRLAERPNFFLKWLFDFKPYAAARIYKCGSVSYGSNFFERLKIKDPYDIDHLEGTNWAMRTDLIRKVGGFDPAFDGVAEWYDTDVVYKIKALGYKLAYRKRAYLYHLVKKGAHFSERFEGWSRIKNWLRFHKRHSKFHPKMIIYFILLSAYCSWQRFRS